MKLKELHDALAALPEQRQNGIAKRSASIGDFLYDLAVHNGLKRTLEIGTCGGRNSAYLTAAVQETGGAHCGMDISSGAIRSAQHLLEELHLQDYGKFITGPSLPMLAQVMYEHEYDLVFIDAEHSFKASYSEWSVANNLIGANSVILFHDVHYRHGDSKGDGGVPMTVKLTGATIMPVSGDQIAYITRGTATIPQTWIDRAVHE